jgi:hypothetical protein
MISLKYAIVGAIIVAITRIYFSHHNEKESYQTFIQSFEDTCVQEANKGVTDPRVTVMIKPVCECLVKNSEMQAELKNAYDKEDITQAKQNVKAIAEKITPRCIQDIMSNPQE